MLAQMTYHPPPPREPSGCVQTLVISRMIFQILAIPIALILGALLSILLFIYAFSESVILGLLVLAAAGFLLHAAIRWEQRRIQREMPPDEPPSRRR
jgi:pilus assembly protein TadC